MKLQKILLTALLFVAFSSVQAQVKTNVVLPDWGVAGNDNARYYYIPDIETYYDIRSEHYVYQNEGKWVKTKTLPQTYQDFDLYDGYKVVIDDENEPYADYENMRTKYAKGYKGDPQKTYKIKSKNGKLKIKEQ